MYGCRVMGWAVIGAQNQSLFPETTLLLAVPQLHPVPITFRCDRHSRASQSRIPSHVVGLQRLRGYLSTKLKPTENQFTLQSSFERIPISDDDLPAMGGSCVSGKSQAKEDNVAYATCQAKEDNVPYATCRVCNSMEVSGRPGVLTGSPCDCNTCSWIS